MTRKTPALIILIIAAFAVSCYDRSDYSPTEAHLSAVLSLQTDGGRSSLPADGFSRLRLVASVSQEQALSRRKVKFSTTLGTIVGGTDRRLEVDLNADGSAIAELQSEQKIATALVTAEVIGRDGAIVAVQKAIEFVAFDPSALIRFSVAPQTAPADNATRSRFTVAVAPELRALQVKFSTDNATFGESGSTTASVPVAGDGTASASLKSPDRLGDATVTAEIGGAAQRASIRFERALPERLEVVLSAFSVSAKADSKVVVTAKLIRDIGQVTDGTQVEIFATRVSSGAPVGSIRNATSTTAGTSTAEFFPGAGTEAGTVTLTVRAEKDGGGTVERSVNLEVTDP